MSHKGRLGCVEIVEVEQGGVAAIGVAGLRESGRGYVAGEGRSDIEEWQAAGWKWSWEVWAAGSRWSGEVEWKIHSIL